MKPSDWPKLLIEAILIVFSVLLALFLNQMVQNSKEEKRKEIALESIEKEIERNLKIIESWQVRHAALENNINSLLDGENDDLWQQMENSDYLKLGLLTDGKSLIDANLNNTAWETAKSTDVISNFDYTTIENLNETYSLQEIIVNTTLNNLVSLYFDRETHDLDNLRPTLLQFKLRMSELTGQEFLLEYLYKQSLEKLQQEN